MKPISIHAALLAGILIAATLPASSQEVTPLDVNDVSFLWPVPKTKADADTLISLADEVSDGPILPLPVFKALMEKAKTTSIIRFPSSAFDDPHTWKVAGIRVNPTALGSNPKALERAEVPGIRLIVQPVTMEGDTAVPQDFAAHVVFNFIEPLQAGQPIKPDKTAFTSIVEELRKIKAGLAAPQKTAGVDLNVHPGFSPDPVPLTAKLKALIKAHLGSKNLDKNQKAAISFMGIPGGFEPWIFFKVEVDTATGTVISLPVNGKFSAQGPSSQGISFIPPKDTGGKVNPAPLNPTSITEVNTSQLFPTKSVTLSRLNEQLLPNATSPFERSLKLRDAADIVANPMFTNTTTTDCVSCHTESTRRHLIPGLTSQAAIRFSLPPGISGVSESVLPKDRWNVRDFGWGLNFDNSPDAPEGFHPTVSQRAANEAAESAAFINQHYGKAN